MLLLVNALKGFGRSNDNILVDLTLPLLRVPLFKAQEHSSHVGIRWIALAEYFHMSTHTSGFNHFFHFFYEYMNRRL